MNDMIESAAKLGRKGLSLKNIRVYISILFFHPTLCQITIKTVEMNIHIKELLRICAKHALRDKFEHSQIIKSCLSTEIIPEGFFGINLNSRVEITY